MPLEPLQVASLGDRFLLVAALNSHISGRVADASPVRVRVDPLRPASGVGHVSGLEDSPAGPPRGRGGPPYATGVRGAYFEAGAPHAGAGAGAGQHRWVPRPRRKVTHKSLIGDHRHEVTN
jgi:hypothetical protein